MSEQAPSKEKACVVCREPWRLGHRCKSTPSTERDEAIVIANRLLDEPMADPDDDLRTLARQFMRALERAGHEPRADRVDLPQNEAQAELMAKVGMMWLEQNAPHRLRTSQPPEAGRIDRLVSAFKQVRADLALQSGTWSNAASYGLMPEDIGLERIADDAPALTKPASRLLIDPDRPGHEVSVCTKCHQLDCDCLSEGGTHG